MKLAIKKTVSIPLRRMETQQVEEERLRKHYDDWIGVAILHTAKYLGYYVGPGKGDTSWEKPIQKYIQRLDRWRRIEAGTLFAVTAYETCVLSVLPFLGSAGNTSYGGVGC